MLLFLVSFAAPVLSLSPLPCQPWPPPHLLTSTEDSLCCQIVSQVAQDRILPVVQLPARDAQVEPQPGRMGVHVARPRDFVVAFLLTGTLP